MTKECQSQLRETLQRVLVQVLEDYAFAFSDFADTCAYAGETAQSHVSFESAQDDETGELTLAAPMDLCQQLASDILGIEVEDVDNDAKVDAFRELSNIVCGRWLIEMFGASAEFRIGVPRTAPLNETDWSQLSSDKASFSVLVDEWPVLARIAVGDRSESWSAS